MTVGAQGFPGLIVTTFRFFPLMSGLWSPDPLACKKALPLGTSPSALAQLGSLFLSLLFLQVGYLIRKSWGAHEKPIQRAGLEGLDRPLKAYHQISYSKGPACKATDRVKAHASMSDDLC